MREILLLVAKYIQCDNYVLLLNFEIHYSVYINGKPDIKKKNEKCLFGIFISSQ